MELSKQMKVQFERAVAKRVRELLAESNAVEMAARLQVKELMNGKAKVNPSPTGVHRPKSRPIVTGKMLIERRFDEAAEFLDGLARVKTGGKVGYIDRKGKC